MTPQIRWGLAVLMGLVVACGPQAGANAPSPEEEAVAESDDVSDLDEEAVEDTGDEFSDEADDEDEPDSDEDESDEEEENPNVKQPDQDKVAALEKKCSPKNQEACFDLAAELDNGLLDVPQLKRVMTLADEACTAGVVRACRSLGERYRDGLQVNRNVNESLKYFKQACKLGDQEACSENGRKKR